MTAPDGITDAQQFEQLGVSRPGIRVRAGDDFTFSLVARIKNSFTLNFEENKTR